MLVRCHNAATTMTVGEGGEDDQRQETQRESGSRRWMDRWTDTRRVMIVMIRPMAITPPLPFDCDFCRLHHHILLLLSFPPPCRLLASNPRVEERLTGQHPSTARSAYCIALHLSMCGDGWRSCCLLLLVGAPSGPGRIDGWMDGWMGIAMRPIG